MKLDGKNVVNRGYQLEGEITVVSGSEEFRYLYNAFINRVRLTGLFNDMKYTGSVVICGRYTFANNFGMFSTFKVRNVDESEDGCANEHGGY